MLGVIIGASLVFAREPQLTKVWSKTYDTQVGGYDAAVPDWNNPAAVKSQAGMRNAIGVGGKLYGVDMRTMSVTEFDSDGFRKAYSLPSLAGRSITYTALDNSGALTTAPDFYGSLITCDEAGHLLIGHGYGTGATCNNWTVLDRATGDTKHLSVDFGEYAKACQPTEIIGRAIGDVTREGYLFVPPHIYLLADNQRAAVGDATGNPACENTELLRRRYRRQLCRDRRNFLLPIARRLGAQHLRSPFL